MAKTEIAQFRAALDELISQAENADLTTPFRKSLQKKVLTAISDLQELLTEIDPVKPPEAVFDPSDPDIVGRFIGIGLIAQDKIELSERKQFYGSGIYAIYYSGRFPLYSEISGTETPIYVGRAIPDKGMGRTPREQGAKLDARIHEHRKNIIKADETLSVADFKYRTLVVASGWEKAAKSYLIKLFAPLWNKETRILFGFGKHGNSAKTRSNKRSPWDTIHTGRKWAGAEMLVDAKTSAEIESAVRQHLRVHPPFLDKSDIFDEFLQSLKMSF